MVISHKHRYLFIEIPQTASWSIRNELVELYDGQLILHKHATYPEFEAFATSGERDYFAFATTRNPLDCLVSAYFKLTTDHKGVFSDAEASVRDFKIDYADKMAYEHYKKWGYSFEATLLAPRIWERPYSGMIDLSANNLDYVMRFERIQDDFAEALRLIGIKQQREVPASNKTEGRKKSWESMYSAEMIPKAKHIYGPYMEKWGYEFPREWGGYEHSKLDEIGYRLSYFMKRIYLVHFQKSDNRIAEWVRRLNGVMKQQFYR